MLKYGIIGGNENALEFIDAADISEKWQLTAAFTETAREMAAIQEKNPGTVFFSDLNAFFQSRHFTTVFISSSSPNMRHFPQIKQAIMAGKNVIIQPPALTNPTEFKEVEQLLRTHPEVHFFEAAYPLHMPNFQNILTAVRKLPAIQGATFTAMQEFRGYDDVLAGKRLQGFTPESAGGALQMLGLYPLYAAFSLFGHPSNGNYFATAINTGADGLGTIFLTYPAFNITIHIGITTDSFMPSEIYGLREKIVIDNITELRLINHYDADHQNHLLNTITYENRLTGEALAFAEILETPNDPQNRLRYQTWLELARDVNTTLFHLRTLVGLKFPTDV